jgi:hypothetical protein
MIGKLARFGVPEVRGDNGASSPILHAQAQVHLGGWLSFWNDFLAHCRSRECRVFGVGMFETKGGERRKRCIAS